MATVIEELGHRKEAPRVVQPLSKEARAAGVGLSIGALLMAIVCLAMKMA